MHAATFPILMNISVAALFVASFFTIALVHPGYTAPLWFAASYGAGMLTPLAQLGLAYTGWTTLFGPIIFFAFAACLQLMVPALAVFYRRPIPWRVVLGIAVLTILAGLLLPWLGRGTPVYVVVYLLPFMVSTAACALVVLRDSPRRGRDLMLAGLFVLLCLHFPLKAAFALSLGTGPLQPNYMESGFAVIGQISTGILMVATALFLLVSVVLVIIQETQTAAETDVLSGILNRRGFELRAASVLARARTRGTPAAMLLIDIDHFKAVNDSYGHSAGDRAIKAFAAMLRGAAPQSALVARLGGEEFAVLLDRTSREMAQLHAEAIRLATLSDGEAGTPSLSVSIGVAEVRKRDALEVTMERADAALYEAKRTGRNKVCSAAEDVEDAEDAKVVWLRRRHET